MQNPNAQQRTFFVERLLKEVLFRESGFAGTNPRIERQKILLQAGAYAGIALITALLVAGLATSYARNRRKWRAAYLRRTYEAGAYRPYEVLAADAAAEVSMPAMRALACGLRRI